MNSNRSLDDQVTNAILSQNIIIQQPSIEISDNFLTIGKISIDIVGKSLQRFKYKSVGYLLIYDSVMKQQIYGDEITINQWFEKLKKYCIQPDFSRHYQLIKVLGQGGQATVYKAKHIQTQKIYAAKCIKQEKQNCMDEGTMKEIIIMAKLNHERCVKIHEIFQENDQIFLILDFLAGGELFECLRDQKSLLDEKSIKEIIFTLFEGLEYLHSKKIIHRDLKPQNILLRKKLDIFDLVISDFGLADFYNQECKYLYQTCGTIGYVAPEILKFEKYDYKVDVFSIGSILYTLFSGKLLVEYVHNPIGYNKNPKPNYAELEERGLTDDAIDFLKGCLKVTTSLRLSIKNALTHKWFKVNIQSKFFTDYNINSFGVKITQRNNSIHQNEYTVEDDDQPIKVLEMLKQYSIDVKTKAYRM
ncbi:hypothetical protein pb186bvf_019260 [Paramecium bursaria]